MAKLNKYTQTILALLLIFGIAIFFSYSNNLIEGYDTDDKNCNKYPTKQEDCLNIYTVKGLNQNNAICDDFDDNGRSCKSRYDTYNSDDKLKVLAEKKEPITNNDWEWHKPIRIKMAKDYTETKKMTKPSVNTKYKFCPANQSCRNAGPYFVKNVESENDSRLNVGCIKLFGDKVNSVEDCKSNYWNPKTKRCGEMTERYKNQELCNKEKGFYWYDGSKLNLEKESISKTGKIVISNDSNENNNSNNQLNIVEEPTYKKQYIDWSSPLLTDYVGSPRPMNNCLETLIF